MIKEGLVLMRSHPKIVDRALIERLLALIDGVDSPEGSVIDRDFVRDELIDLQLYRAIPLPDMFAQNQEKQYFEKLKPSCMEAGESYADRVARRKEEIESLQEAVKILDGEAIR